MGPVYRIMKSEKIKVRHQRELYIISRMGNRIQLPKAEDEMR